MATDKIRMLTVNRVGRVAIHDVIQGFCQRPCCLEKSVNEWAYVHSGCVC
jgi:hypothetical protein